MKNLVKFLVLGVTLALMSLATIKFVDKLLADGNSAQTKTKTVITNVLPNADSIFVPVVKWEHDTVVMEKTVYVYMTIHDSIKLLIPVDTAEIVKDYLTQRDYTLDTIAGTTKATVNTSIFANRIILQKLTFENTPNKPKIGVSVGIVGGLNEVAPMVQIRKGKIELQFGYNITGNTGVRTGVFYTIK